VVAGIGSDGGLASVNWVMVVLSITTLIGAITLGSDKVRSIAIGIVVAVAVIAVVFWGFDS
jgi:ABC-type nickel/cobalt efflux system permease component RcnA